MNNWVKCDVLHVDTRRLGVCGGSLATPGMQGGAGVSPTAAPGAPRRKLETFYDLGVSSLNPKSMHRK